VNSIELSPRAYQKVCNASSWEEIWEAGPYYDRISELLEGVEDYAVFVGWQIDSRLLLKRPNPFDQNHPAARVQETLKEKVIRLCESKSKLHIYFLIWDHAYFYMFERELWQGRVWEDVHPRVHFVFDNRHTFGASHHEKLILIDGKVAFCGGIDLCNERWDSSSHLYEDSRRSPDRKREKHGPYHDLAVQVRGSICAEIQNHVADRWRSLSSIPFPASKDGQWNHQVQPGHQILLSRTVSSIDPAEREVPLVREVEFLFRDLIQSAQHRIILEGQYYWSRTIHDLLISKILTMKGKKFELIVILAELQFVKSWTRHMMAYELRLLQRLMLAAEYAGIQIKIGAPYVIAPEKATGLRLPKPVYIHSKVIVIDDRFLGVGSANLATRALRVDTEIHLTLAAQTEAERRHIDQVAETILNHWGLGLTRANPSIQFRCFLPGIELKHLKRNLSQIKRIPWGDFFDPQVPWFFKVKMLFRRLCRRNSGLLKILLVWLWLSGICVGGWMSSAWKTSEISVAVYGILFSSMWLLPLPFLPILIFSVIQLGPDLAAHLAVATFWISAGIGYSVARVFPKFSRKFFGLDVSNRVHLQLGLRQFSQLLGFLFDPRLSVRDKILFQGLYCVPMPWFLLGTMMVMPSFYYCTSRALAEVAFMLNWKLGQGQVELNYLIFLAGLTFILNSKVYFQVWKKEN
jgi:phosphatidylserine/phosphatidylglycerophosphate/cardiolipin synthase-like enzyme